MIKNTIIAFGLVALLSSGAAFAQPVAAGDAAKAVNHANEANVAASKAKAAAKVSARASKEKAKVVAAKPQVGARNGSKVTVKTKNGKTMTFDCAKAGNKTKSFCK